MNSRSLSTIAIVGFLLLGGIFMGLRYRAVQMERTAIEESMWQLTYDLEFRVDSLPSQQSAQLCLALPFETPYCAVRYNTPTIPNPNLDRVFLRPFRDTQNRFLQLSTKQDSPDPYMAMATFDLRLSPRPYAGRRPSMESLSPDAEQTFLKDKAEIPISISEVRQLVQQAQSESDSNVQQMQWVFEYCSSIGSGSEAAFDNVKDAIANRRATPLAQARTMVAVCRALGFPSRLVTGFIIRQGSVQPHVWAEVFHKQSWVPFDPVYGYSFSLPPNYLPVRRNADQIYWPIANVTIDSIKYSIRRLLPDPQILAGEVDHPVQILDLRRLPVPMHTVIKLLLLLPFAALITSVMRNVVGLQTFGTFAPALLAMSFIYADWETGLAILLVVVTAGLVGRLWLERLRLLMVPRLSIILTLVILCVVFSVSALDFMKITHSPQAVLLPMVILTILIERFHVTVEEDGVMYAIQLAVGTVVVAALCYLMLGWDEVGAWVLRYPEAHFFTIAAFILLGRYAGYRLTELWRFRDLIEPSEPRP